MTKTAITLLIGAIAGAALVLACSDDAPPAADAAEVCDCPAAEPPLAGRIILSPEATVTIAANSRSGTLAGCPDGGTLIGGSCQLTSGRATLEQSWANLNGAPAWDCSWENNEPGEATGSVKAICLMPAAAH